MTPIPPKLGILAGGGTLPALLVDACHKAGRGVHVVTFKGQPKPDGLTLTDTLHTEVPLGHVSATLGALKAAGVAQVVLAGNLSKPSLFDLRPDLKAAKVLASLWRQHDDDILRHVCALLEAEGFSVVGAHTLLPDLLAGVGALGRCQPSEAERGDITLGLRVARALGAEDVGQGVVVKDRVVIGVEAVEGTDALLQRCAALRGKGQGGVLVKVCKPAQDMRVDLPAIGPKTIQTLAQHGYAGVAVEAGKTLLLESDKTLALADKNGIFIYGAPHDGASSAG
jgi:DUF1009 family protein